MTHAATTRRPAALPDTGISGCLTLVIAGPPRTKKTSNIIATVRNRSRVLPSAAYRDWDTSAQKQLAAFRASSDWKLPLRCNLNCAALFFRAALVGDAVGFYQALADTLQKGGIVENDRQIVSWDGSRMLKDAENPRVIVRLEPVV